MKRLLVLRLSALGDVIHTIPAVVGLKQDHDVTWVVEAPYRELVEIVAGVKTIPVRMKKEPKTALQAVREMRGFDAAIDFQGLIKSAMLPWAARVPDRYGFEHPREKLAGWLSNRNVPVDPTRHVIDQNLELAAAIGPLRPMGPIGPSWPSFPQEIQAEGAIILLPGAGKPNKIWPYFRELAKSIGPRALVVWGPGERALAEATQARMAPPTNLRQLAFLLKNAEVVIGGDTGPLHLAAALGTKVIGLYGPTDPRRNGPYGQLERVIDRFRSTKSMQSISVEEVMNTLERVASE
ncbi:MAG TPA: glycosyltransferase family 9 protein [Thermoanaerobaculia bacterium]|nr:glycosyltransferase family 9 protein [Thermoanaerobaculia bacterium]